MDVSADRGLRSEMMNAQLLTRREILTGIPLDAHVVMDSDDRAAQYLARATLSRFRSTLKFERKVGINEHSPPAKPYCQWYRKEKWQPMRDNLRNFLLTPTVARSA